MNLDVCIYELLDPSALGEEWKLIRGVVGPDHGQPGGGAQYLIETILDKEIGIEQMSPEKLILKGVLRKLSNEEAAAVLEDVWKSMGRDVR